MKIANEFTVSAPIEQAWEVLSDLEEVAPLLPGAQMTGREGDDYLGKVKVKVGPVTSEFKGKATFVERDEKEHRAVIDARGRDSRGSGNASATITAQLHEAGDGTRVTVDTDMKIVGKLAQFGSGMIQQVSEKLMGQFAESLEAKLSGGPADQPAAEPETAGTATDSAATTTLSVARPAAEPAPLDLLALSGAGAWKRYAPILAAVLAGIVVVLVVGRRRR
ncbi:SRPBCC family protein [Rhodococcus sp. NCIMB 12038]|jgi:carbon monoxide dehydrogenase subunit G|uniref:SRPBCC family protein n=1 Tax=Rhodococcus sp. NCIMB 12038 TaxID=933800 RepID=UPI000B3C05AE|nr:SRPBCC family protein [Rhodococcus sp. NCIMB 12038]OUS97622.1 membrane oxidoreductase [Rhodococcus sp. NCIMB 12038]